MTSSDLAQVASLHRVAFASSLGVSLGHSYVRRMLAHFLAANDAISLICEIDGTVAGYVFGAPDDEWPKVNRRLLPTIAFAVLTHPAVMLHPDFRGKIHYRVKSLLTHVTPIDTHTDENRARAPAPVYDLVGIGVDPRRRGRGVAQALMAAFEEMAPRLGYRSLLLSAYSDNHAARRLYERRHWDVLSDDGRAVYYVKTFDLPPPSGPKSLEGTP